MIDIPTYEPDIFSEEGILDPYPHYERLRELGPVVHLAAQDILAVGRYDSARAVLEDHETFRSGAGVLWNEGGNRQTRGTTLASDPPLHDHLRHVVAHRLTPRALRDERPRVQAAADLLITNALSRRSTAETVEFEAVAEIAQAMPMAVIPDFIGFPEECRHRLIDWAVGAIESGAPVSERTEPAVAVAVELGDYVVSLAARGDFADGTLGSELMDAVKRETITAEQCPPLLLDYFGPSLETTASALGSALALFAENPDQWQLLRRDPTLVGGAINEVLRLESPLRGFTRLSSAATIVCGVDVPAQTRVAVLYGCANRDGRKWAEPDRFDITRANADHLALGYGIHGCAGQGFARLEMAAVLIRLAERVARIELAAEPSRKLNSLIRAYARLPLRLWLDNAAAPEDGDVGGAISPTMTTEGERE